MAAYWVKTPHWIKRFFPVQMVWDMPVDDEQSVYITFDDGPHPVATPYALQQLERYDAAATFFCVGNNVATNPDIYNEILQKGHTTGNHTYEHVNGWKTDSFSYMRSIEKTRRLVKSRSFRPPYGRIKFSQVRKMIRRDPSWKIYMWDILSGDFDKDITSEQCLENVLTHITPGSIVVFHDSDKAWTHMRYALPHVLEYCRKQNWKMKALPK